MGKVWFIGAGPGSPDLLTIRGARLIAEADVVVWARSLVHEGVLEHASPGAEIVEGLTVNREVVSRRLAEEVPFLAMEELLMAATTAGGDRQTLHEALRRHAIEVRRKMVEEGAPNDLFARIATDPNFAALHDRLEELGDPARFTGRARQQTDRYLDETVAPWLEREADRLLEGDEGTRV